MMPNFLITLSLNHFCFFTYEAKIAEKILVGDNQEHITGRGERAQLNAHQLKSDRHTSSVSHCIFKVWPHCVRDSVCELPHL